MNAMFLINNQAKAKNLYMLNVGKHLIFFQTNYKILCKQLISKMAKAINVPDNPDIQREIRYWTSRVSLEYVRFTDEHLAGYYKYSGKGFCCSIPLEDAMKQCRYFVLD